MIVSVVAGRQHAVKAAEVHRGLVAAGIEHGLIDAGFWGRPYSEAMATQLGLPTPQVELHRSRSRTW